jgi:hypothetical protein
VYGEARGDVGAVDEASGFLGKSAPHALRSRWLIFCGRAPVIEPPAGAAQEVRSDASHWRGIGSLEGAVIAAILYAVVHTLVTTFFDGVIANIVGLLLMLAVLIVRPQGLFGAQERA